MAHEPVDWDESVTADTDADLDTVRHTWSESTRPSVSIVEAVAAATGRTVDDLPPLQRSIDAESLDALLTRTQSSPVSASFRYADADVRAQGNGLIEIRVDARETPGR